MILVMQAFIKFHANERRDEIFTTKVNEIEFESSWKETTDRGKLIIPRNLKFFDKRPVRELFKRGDKISVYMGYHGFDNVSQLEFEGYISKVSSGFPIEIEFEDEMYHIRKLPVHLSTPNITLKELFQKMCPGYELDILEKVQMGAIRLVNTQVGPVLEKIQQDWGLYTFMRNGVITCGKYYDNTYDQVSFDLERECVSHSLNYHLKDEISILIKAISTLPNGVKLEANPVGDKDGNERTLSYFNIKDKSELERLARLDYEKYKQDKFEGSFTTFGYPPVKHGMKCKLTSTLYPEREGIYYVESIQKSFGMNGFRQDVTLGDKV
jgi:hypothetical protein